MWRLCYQGGNPCQICVSQNVNYGPNGKTLANLVSSNMVAIDPKGEILKTLVSTNVAAMESNGEPLEKLCITMWKLLPQG